MPKNKNLSKITSYLTADTDNGILSSNVSQTITGSLTVTGNLTAQQFIVSSSVTYLTQSFASGSNRFGNSSDDTHQFTGSLVVSGSANLLTVGTNLLFVSSSGNVGIGTASPSTKLHVYEALTNASAHLTIQNNRARNAAVYTVTSNGGFYAGTSIGTDTFNYQIYDAVAGEARLTIASTGAATFSSTVTANGSVTANGLNINGIVGATQTSAARIVQLDGNSNNQGAAINYRILRHYPVVSSGNKLIIPFVDQGNLNSSTIVRIFGHSARFNSNNVLGFTADFGLGHLNQLLNLAVYNSTGNISSITVAGMNIEIQFTNSYAGATANGIYVTIDYMTNSPSYSINVANITMN